VFVITASMDMTVRPLLEDAAVYLPAGFEPAERGWPLRLRMTAALLSVTLFSAMTAGAWSDVIPRGVGRLLLAFGIALVTVGVAGVIFWILGRSALDPLDEVLDGFRRVGAGDLETPARLLSADELGELAVGFNRM